MKLVIQRVQQASVSIENTLYSQIDYGYLILVGISSDDNIDVVKAMAKKVAELRICEDQNQKMNLSVKDISGEILSVSQFTLYADCRKGRRPSFTEAASPAIADQLYQQFNQSLEEMGLKVKTGVFQADMQVGLINDGPVTIVLDSDVIIKR